MSKLPFIPSLFFKTLVAVLVLVIGTWALVLKMGWYDEMTPADYGGTTISAILFAICPESSSATQQLQVLFLE